MKIGDIVKYKDWPQIWVVYDVFDSFVIIKHETTKKSIYKEFWNMLKPVPPLKLVDR